MNHAVFWVTPKERPSSCDEMPFFGDQPNGRKPLVESKRRILEDCPDFERELTLATKALPKLARGEERNALALATRASNGAISPAKVLDELKATVGIREVADRFDEGIWQAWRVVLHELIIPGGCDIYSPCLHGHSRRLKKCWTAGVTPGPRRETR